MKMHEPTDEERGEVAATAAIITQALLDDGHGPGFAGAVLTVTMSHILALMDDDLAEKAMEMHSLNALKLRGFLRAQIERMRH